MDPDTPHTVVEIESDDGEDPEPVMLQLESDQEFDRVDKSKERLAKKARMAADLNTTEENGWEHGGVKRKFSSAGGVKDMKNPKRVRRVKTTGMSKLNSHEVSRRRGFISGNRVDGSRLGIRNNHYSEGGLLVSFSLDLSVCSEIVIFSFTVKGVVGIIDDFLIASGIQIILIMRSEVNAMNSKF